ncbi:MAG: D-alanyl-D-alanine carboxypeptidase/D-alanyl-D-alanine-endopeptidase [Thermodesulfobacteriota bacterium]
MLCLLWPAHVEAGALDSKLAAILQKALPPEHTVSLLVVDLGTGRTVMEKNPHTPLSPASTMKIVTSSTALKVLKPDYCFVTEVLADGLRGPVASNLYLRGSGDPHLVSEQLFALTREVRALGLAEVRGDIVVDASRFIPGEPIDEQEQLGSRAYHARYGALSLNFNSVRLLVQPGPRAGEPAAVSMDPVSDYASLNADVKTVKGNQPLQVNATRELTASGRDAICVSGTIGERGAAKGRYVNVGNPAIYTGEVFKEFLLREGIRVSGRVVEGAVSADAVPYYEFRSEPLGLMVYWLNKFSNNFMAEQINMTMGAQVFGLPGTREKGLEVIRKHLLDCGVKESEFFLAEASGLSRHNRLSASALVRVLLAAARDFTYGQEFMASFGVAGIDGTLKEKFLDRKRRLRAKTGNLRGVNALAGFGTSRDHRVFVFAVIVNADKKGAGFIDYGEKIIRRILDVPLG